jgi:hypothetical protein
VHPYHGTETPAVLEKYKQASSQLLLALGAVVYPALREDAPNETGQYPIEYDVGWYTSASRPEAVDCTTCCAR